MARDIVDVAIGELGYTEQGENRTKYGAWYGMNGAAWCHMFVSWCAYKAGVSTSVVPKTASTDTGMAWFKKKKLFRYKGKYTPKRGDIVYFKTGRSHVGIVEKVTGNTLHTVEGNFSKKVVRRTYPLTNATITGYGVPKYATLNNSDSSSGGGGSTSKNKKKSKQELTYLKKVLKKKKPADSANIKSEVNETGKLPNGVVTVTITNGKKNFTVPVKEDMKIVWERTGTPGKLTFEAKYDKQFKIVEGNSVLVTVDGTNFFFGFVFTRNFGKDGIVSYTAYDQMRYLKNKDIFIYKQKRADQVIKMLAERFNMQCGKLANTRYIISKRAEENITLFDIIQNALDETLMAKGKVYVLYDKCGKLCLTDVADMKVDSCLVDKETGEEYSYQTSIDSDVYNQIKLYYQNSKKEKNDIYMVRDKRNINKWGMLQYAEKIDDPDVGKLKSSALLKLYNKKRRSLSVSGVIGNKKVRAGSLVPIILNVRDMKIANYMMVEKVTHTFNNRQHSMDLVLSGGDFIG